MVFYKNEIKQKGIGMNRNKKILVFNIIFILIIIIIFFLILFFNKNVRTNISNINLPANPNVAEEQAITEKYEQNAEQLEKLEEELKSLQKKYDELKQKSEAAEMQIGELEEKLKEME